MKARPCLFILILYALLAHPVYAQDATKAGIVYGDNWAYVAQAPSGWIMDMNTLAPDGIYGLFYEEGKIFGAQYNTSIIYIVPFKLNNPTDEALIKFADSDLNTYTSNGAKVEKITKTYEKPGNTYLTYNVNLPNGRHETFVFTRYKDTCFIIILNTTTSEQRQSLLSKLEEVINKLSFMDRD